MDYLHPHGQDVSSFSIWNNFFLLAGIPNSVAHEYAVTFSQHRIRIDMLKEITKEILLDMGIKAMGDIIAILRHAKNLYTQDELKGGTSKVIATNTTDTITPRQNSVNHVSQRTPITTRSGPSISSTVGTKVPSLLSLNSGALLATSNNNQAISHTTSTSNNNHNNKRSTSSKISISLSKRPRTNLSTPALTEKTLSVHYPSSSAIARARQRIMKNTGSSPLHRNSPSTSVKSRLGPSLPESSSLTRPKSTVFKRLGK